MAKGGGGHLVKSDTTGVAQSSNKNGANSETFSSVKNSDGSYTATLKTTKRDSAKFPPSLPTNIHFDFWDGPVYTKPDGTKYCPGYMGNVVASNPWDYVEFNPGGNAQPYRTPGICEVICGKQRARDQKKAPGGDGATLTLLGLEPSEVTIQIVIWTPEQLDALASLYSVIFPGPSKATTTTTTSVYSQQLSNSGLNSRLDTSTGSYYNTNVNSQVTLAENAETVFSANNSIGFSRTVTSPTVTIPRFAPDSTKTSKKSTTTFLTDPFQVYHPKLKFHRISAIAIVGADGPDPGPFPRSRIFTIHAIEFLPAKNVDATATAKSARKGNPNAGNVAVVPSIANAGKEPNAEPGEAKNDTGPNS